MAKETLIQLYYTLTPGRVPDANDLLYGELALGLGDTPIKIWIGVPTSVNANGYVDFIEALRTALQTVFDERYVQRA